MKGERKTKKLEECSICILRELLNHAQSASQEGEAVDDIQQIRIRLFRSMSWRYWDESEEEGDEHESLPQHDTADFLRQLLTKMEEVVSKQDPPARVW